ncbi:uncharacterized protein DSM5745_09618 [Aspergillus mulundensis]|uniref:F-box domain-containing protein n=1 Tax=Aspergillus mulundensis TaxID=1810919 RepID=A0A3D8QVT9_9EURO|nr:hypothetical protein DSM5745_09618 [Aspergillus mulundensis]RDW65879.1 hypothetical protein DSM5745_09618 [Aspergillus mulundensis]
MEPTVRVRCIVCGADIEREGRSEDTWLQSYSMVYRTEQVVHVSAIGVRRRQNDEASFKVPVQKFTSNNEAWIQVPILQEADSCFGFLLHNACWCLLERRAWPLAISLPRLYEVFDSAPRDWTDMQSCCYTWDHMYEGTTGFVPLHWRGEGMRWPWEERRWRETWRSVTVKKAFLRSPFACTVYDLIRIAPTQSMPFDFSALTESSVVSDGFTRLPFEIVEEIASYLPTATVLQLRSVSRAFTRLFYSQMFWASRFKGDFERSFLFEAHETRSHRDWRWLYQRTRNVHLAYPGLENRLRIWRLTELLLKKLNLSLADSSTHLAIKRRLSNWERAEVHGDILVGNELRRKGSGLRILTHETQVPPDVQKIGVSVLEDGETTYVAGIQLVHGSDQQIIQLGYVTTSASTTYTEVGSLDGLIVSVGSRGIHALQIVHSKNGSLSPWLGCPHSGAKTRRLAFPERVVALSVGLDGYKMVYISIWGRRMGGLKKQEQHEPIMDNLLWFPELPDSTAHLNVSSTFGSMDSSTKGFRPVICTSFGGPGGADLQSLIRVFATMNHSCLVNIGFGYKSEVTCCPQRMLSPNQSNVGIQSMEINGPEGEFIEKIEVGTRQCEPDIISGLRLTTNRGRSCTFTGSFCGCEQYTLLRTAAGTIPTGLYATQESEGFENMGIISHKVEPW